jgi:hypothetical protein
LYCPDHPDQELAEAEQLKAHLVRCEKAMQSAKPILGKHAFNDEYRTKTVIGFISMLIEHQESVLLLVMHEKTGSAFALARPIIEGAYRGMWLNLPATLRHRKVSRLQRMYDLAMKTLRK